MRWILTPIFWLGLGFPALAAQSPIAKLCYPESEILSAVAWNMGVTLRADVPLPKVIMSSDVSLKDFQDYVEPQWGFRPNVVANVYIAARNEIYLIDEADYYRRMKRFIDDSLAHEYVHYFQIRYKGYRFDPNDETMEHQAVHVQTWFRTGFLLAPDSPRRCSSQPPQS